MALFLSGQVISNRALGDNFYLLETGRPAGPPPRTGQFYMIRAWETCPVLSRPLSVFDAGEDRLAFLYKIAGRGTGLFSALKAGDHLDLLGPLGKGFPDLNGTIALVGGGAGIAPFYLGTKQIRAAHPECSPELFLGYSGKPFLTEEFKALSNRLTINTGGFITDEIANPADYDYIFTCGPEAMMRALFAKCEAAGVGDILYVSLESRMACGAGACFVCSRETSGGNKKVCKDGPVFKAREVFGI
jgi:dihydroorotate dehydrogenase electron transfer subunit